MPSSNQVGEVLARVEGATGPRLVHFASRQVARVRTVKQRNPEHLICHHTKPEGFWVSDEASEDSWSAWCEAEQFGSGQLAHAVTLAPDANILRLRSADDIDAFGREYGRCPEHQHFRDEPAIFWADVARDYDGILITPYIWSRRLHRGSSWYYGWDCASGCIWNGRAVSALRALANQETDRGNG